MSEIIAMAAKITVVMFIELFYRSYISKCYNSPHLFRKMVMTKRTVEDPKALHSSQKISQNNRYGAYRSSHVFPRIAPPALMGDYRGAWSTFILEMQLSQKCGEIILKLYDISNLCIFLAIPPSVFFYMMDEEIRVLVQTFYGQENWEKVKEKFSDDFFKTLSAGMMARIQYWETGSNPSTVWVW